MLRTIFLLAIAILFARCKKASDESGAKLAFKFVFDKNQARLNNIGQPAPVPVGNAAQTPEFREMSVHYIELAPSAFTLLGRAPLSIKARKPTKEAKELLILIRRLRVPRGRFLPKST